MKKFYITLLLVFFSIVSNSQSITFQTSCNANPITLLYSGIEYGKSHFSYFQDINNSLDIFWWPSGPSWVISGQINGIPVDYWSYSNTTPNPPSFGTGNWEINIGSCTLIQVSGSGTTSINATTTQNNVSCNGGTNGSCTVTASGSTAPYTYSWSPSGGTSATASSLVAGTYSCTITDASSNAIVKTVTITEPTAISTTGTQTNVSCKGGSNGSATVTASGGTSAYTYSWSPSGGTGTTASGLSAGNYTCTVTDANSCTKTKNFTITEPTMISTTGTQTNVYCNGGSNGSATVTASGGVSGYTYSWSPSGGTGTTASGLSAGNYTCTVTDANSCTKTKNFTITEPTVISTTGTQTNVSCNGGSNGSATVTASGGVSGYTYSWSPSGGTGTTASGLSAGNYTCTVTDANSCTKTKNFTITEPTAITATTSYTNATCWNYSNGSASVTPSGGSGSYTYLWSPYGETWATIDAEVGNYTCTITDASGCSIQKNFTITQPAALDLGITVNQSLLTANQSSSVTYQWNYCNGGAISGATQQTYTATTVGSYELVIAMISNPDCEYTTSCVTVTTLSTNDFDLTNKLKLYPNPAQNQVTIEVNELTNASLQILDINGRLLQTKKLDNTSNTINIENLQSGVYLFKIASNEGTTTQRVVKN